MKSPQAGCVCGDIERELFSGLEDHGVFARVINPVAVVEFHEHAVQMQWMLHHGVVDPGEAEPLAEVKLYWLLGFGVFFAVESPDVALHVTRRVELDFALGRALVVVGDEALEVVVSEDAPRHPFESGARFAEAVDRSHRDHGISRAVLVGAVHRGCPAAGHVHAGHGVARTSLHSGHSRHVAHAHVGHGADRAFTPLGQRGAHARLRSKRSAGEAAAVGGFGEDRVSAASFRLDDHVVGFRDANAEFIHGHRLHILAIGLDDGHPHAGDSHVEEGHCRRIDETQTHPFARLENAGPVRVRREAVHQEGEVVPGDVGDVGRIHPHFGPLPTILGGRGKSVFRSVADEIAERPSLVIRVAVLFFQLG